MRCSMQLFPSRKHSHTTDDLYGSPRQLASLRGLRHFVARANFFGPDPLKLASCRGEPCRPDYPYQQRMPTNNRRIDATVTIIFHPLPTCERICRNGSSLAKLPNLLNTRWRMPYLPNQTLPVSLYQCIGCHRRAGSKQQASPEITAAATHRAAHRGPADTMIADTEAPDKPRPIREFRSWMNAKVALSGHQPCRDAQAHPQSRQWSSAAPV